MSEVKQLREVLSAIVQTNGVANCYDRYCHDDEWTYCIFCGEGDHNPHAKPGWKHKPDCVVLKARVLLAIDVGLLPVGYEVTRYPPKGQWHGWKDDQEILENGLVKWFDTEFEARLFCWEQAKEKRGISNAEI